MILTGKNAVIYGAGGSLGGAVAKAFAAAGAHVFLTSLHEEAMQKVASEIRSAGRQVDTRVLDASDSEAVRVHLGTVGMVDISFNLAGEDLVQGIPLADMSVEDFLAPILFMLRIRFVTATAAARVMRRQGPGVILSLTATPGGIGYPLTAGFAAACAAMETFSSNLAAEEGIYGTRVVNIRSGGSPDSRVFLEAVESNPMGMANSLRQMEGDTMLKRLPMMQDIANAAVFLASDGAGMITGVTVDVTGGTTGGLNYRMQKP